MVLWGALDGDLEERRSHDEGNVLEKNDIPQKIWGFDVDVRLE